MHITCNFPSSKILIFLFCRWSEIKDITNSKRNIIIKHTDGTLAVFSLVIF